MVSRESANFDVVKTLPVSLILVEVLIRYRIFCRDYLTAIFMYYQMRDKWLDWILELFPNIFSQLAASRGVNRGIATRHGAVQRSGSDGIVIFLTITIDFGQEMARKKKNVCNLLINLYGWFESMNGIPNSVIQNKHNQNGTTNFGRRSSILKTVDGRRTDAMP